MGAYDGLDPAEYERELIASGADPKDAAEARRDLERRK